MKSLPVWVKVLGVLVLAAALIGAAQLLLWIDQLGSVKGGLD